jgi:hypothetical protein
MLFKEIIPFYTENDMKPTNTLCEQNADFLIRKASGTQ